MFAMKIALLLVCLAVYVSNTVHCAPAELAEDVDHMEVLDNVYIVPEERADRHRRITCDLLSYGGTINHSACAAHCLFRGKAGGRCNNGICQCRRTNFKDLFKG